SQALPSPLQPPLHSAPTKLQPSLALHTRSLPRARRSRSAKSRLSTRRTCRAGTSKSRNWWGGRDKLHQLRFRENSGPPASGPDAAPHHPIARSKELSTSSDRTIILLYYQRLMRQLSHFL